MGDIKVGDYVFDEMGLPTQVTYVTPVMYGLKCYEVQFADGEKIVVGADHLWLTETHYCRKALSELTPVVAGRVYCRTYRKRRSTNQKAKVRTTEEIKNSLLVSIGGKVRPNHSIQLCQAVKYPKQDLLVDPYVLGVWLGDGTSHNGDITGVDEEILSGVEQFYHRYQKPSCKERGQTWSFEELPTALKVLNLYKNKHVPSQYLIGSVEQRLALLQGLMDTDGTISKNGHCCFDNTNKNLADSVAELAWSLGIKVTREQRVGKLNGVAKKLCYRVRFTTDLPVFRLNRKLARIRSVAAKAKRRYIASVREVESVPSRCIKVANPSHLYLADRAYTVTHNTVGCSIWLAQEAWNHKNFLLWWVAPSYAQAKNACELLKQFLPARTYEESKSEPSLTLLEPDGSPHSKIVFKSGDNPDTLRGFAVNRFVLDEAARMPFEAYTSVYTTVTQTMGKGLIISTPKGRGWFYDLYQRGVKDQLAPGEKDPWPDWMSVRLPSWTNPHVPMESIKSFKDNMPEDVFRQEVAAEFLQESAGVFRNIKNCCRGKLEASAIPGRRYVLGVDLAKYRDFSVIIVMDCVRKCVVYYDRFNQLEWIVQEQRIRNVSRVYNHAVVCIDSTGPGDQVVENLRGGGTPMEPYKIGTSASKQALIEKLRINIEHGIISYPEIPELIKELEVFEYKITETGIVRYTAPEGKHDDMVIALALANWLADGEAFKYTYKNVRGL